MVERFFTEAGGRAHLITMPEAQPVVYAEFDGESGPMLAFYNHYDIQPPDRWNAGGPIHLPPRSVTDEFGRGARGTTRAT
jgi:acetylornithine deacetylase/succinyl-diaminopimelate desuccinylase-like protein